MATSSNIFSVYNSTDAVFFGNTNEIGKFVDANIDKITIDKPWWTTEVKPRQSIFVSAYQLWLNKDTRTKLITAEKNASREELEPYIAQTIEALRADPKVTATQLRALDIYRESHSSHPIPTTTLWPEMSVQLDTIKRVTVEFKPHGEATKGKPLGVSHIEVAWDDDLDVPPKKVSELKNVDIFTRSPFILGDFEEDQRGSAVYMAARYVMNADVSGYGPWSGITFAIIP